MTGFIAEVLRILLFSELFVMLYNNRPWQAYYAQNLLIMLLSIAHRLSLLCSKLCFQNQDYALELTVLLEYISLSWLLY